LDEKKKKCDEKVQYYGDFVKYKEKMRTEKEL
jgi:hypothetical protein